ncbi:transcriptional regulator, XRE family [Acetanaerobacterium elongatum]|uniref:Transcriptional regulator, XRE family n=1 Tax=Acetanaerobacterium elongatum TaxID=258515 RepID=A0A1H0GH58_9FIRM|nr:transcriptional regulator, XRE family [Acetanaerobacterium elongatum]
MEIGKVDYQVHLRIKDIRQDKDLTQKQIADYLICDQSLYSKYERGERELPLYVAVKLAQYYEVSLDYLVGLTDETKPYPNKRG